MWWQVMELKGFKDYSLHSENEEVQTYMEFFRKPNLSDISEVLVSSILKGKLQIMHNENKKRVLRFFKCIILSNGNRCDS